jgi:hypothetical protein
MKPLLLVTISALTLLWSGDQAPVQNVPASELSCGAMATRPAAAIAKPKQTGIVGLLQHAKEWFQARPQLVVWEPSIWKTTNLRVAFLDGDPAARDFVMGVAKEWQQGLKLTFSQSQDTDAELRVTFTGTGVWSKVGIRAVSVANGQPTMGLNGVTQTTDVNLRRAYVLHEFGHALGAMHEHQRPDAPLTWNEDIVNAYYLKTYGWGPDQVKKEVILPHQYQKLVVSPEFDRLSVMMYPVLKDFTKEGFVQPWNSQLTTMDRSTMAGFYK